MTDTPGNKIFCSMHRAVVKSNNTLGRSLYSQARAYYHLMNRQYNG
nr:hypothetical protein [Bacillus cereus]